jgi:Fur family ferric uptake transcriptional regulator
MHITSDHLLEALRSQGLRITAARRAVCAVVAERHGQHLTAARILEGVRSNQDARVDRSTVYRTLDALEESGLLIHSHLGHGPAVYHLAAEADHQHVVCTKCGAAVSIPAESLDGWIITLRETTGFEVDPAHFAATGLCAECAARRVSTE